ncbi:protein of unknown function [Methylorubrum extorquens]|uniref:Uncharacterized protein n=1 Tax=Methylorubrum extorquens TaxID=408 RepID=A0A2N9AJQ5_METEX|nr:protein of unknown function [Methylorubrum extorquens]
MRSWVGWTWRKHGRSAAIPVGSTITAGATINLRRRVVPMTSSAAGFALKNAVAQLLTIY